MGIMVHSSRRQYLDILQQCYKSWEVYLGHREFVSTVVHMTVKEQYPLLDIACIRCLSKLPSPCKKYSCSCSYSMSTELLIELLHMH